MGMCHSQLSDSDLNITCVDCSFNYNFSLNMDFEMDLGNSTCVSSSGDCVTITKAAMNVTVVELEQSTDLEIAVGEPFSQNVTYTSARTFFTNTWTRR